MSAKTISYAEFRWIERLGESIADTDEIARDDGQRAAPPTKPELEAIIAVVRAFQTSSPATKRRLCRGVGVLLASTDGRYSEQIDVHLGQLEKFADDLGKGGAA